MGGGKGCLRTCVGFLKSRSSGMLRDDFSHATDHCICLS